MARSAKTPPKSPTGRSKAPRPAPATDDAAPAEGRATSSEPTAAGAKQTPAPSGDTTTQPGGARADSSIPGVPPGIDPALRTETVVPAPPATSPEASPKAASETQAAPQDNDAPAGAAQPLRPTAAPELPPAPRRRTTAPMVLGGALAAALGFGAAIYMDRESLWPFDTGADFTAQTESLSNALADQQAQIEATEATLEALGARINDVEAAETDTAAQTQAATDALAETLRAEMAQLEARIDTLEARPAAPEADTAEVPEQLTQDIAALRDEINALRELAETAGQEASAASAALAAQEENEAQRQAAADAREALRRIEAALDEGVPYRSAIDTLEQAGFDAPEPLAARADDGVPTLAALQTTFPPAARAALDTARRELDEDTGMGARIVTFLQVQTGARSLSPREGDDTDAILSRAEAALQRGALDAALQEVAALPAPARTHLDSWQAQARTRLEAAMALDALAGQIDTL